MSKTFLVIGASTGFGRALTKSLAAKGHVVFAGARKPKDPDALNASAIVRTLRLDVGDQRDVDTAGRGLDGLVNNEGVAILSSIGEAPKEDVRYQMETDAFGVWRVTKAMLPMLIASKRRVVRTSSMSGIVSQKPLGFYCMSKHAAEAFTDALADEMKNFGVSVSAIEPGNFATEVGQTWADKMKARGASFEGYPVPVGGRDHDGATAQQRRQGGARARCRCHGGLAAERCAEGTVSGRLQPAGSGGRAARPHQKARPVQPRNKFTYSRDALVKMLDEAIARPGGASA